MKRHTWLMLAIITLIAFGVFGIYAYRDSIFELQPEQTPTTAPQPTEFSQISDVLAAYAGDGFDQSFTPLELNREVDPVSREVFPRIKPAIFDDQGNFLATIGDGGQALLIGKFAVTSAAVASETAHPLPQGNDLPTDLRDKTLKRGAILVFGVRPDGIQEYEILERSLGKDQNNFVELFERPNYSSYFYPPSLPYAIADIKELNIYDESAPLTFYGYGGAGVVTKKQAWASAIDYESSLFYFDGSVTTDDLGSLVFVLKNGQQRLVGLIIGSFMRAGNETKAEALGITEVLKFIEEKSGIVVKTEQKQTQLIEKNPVLRNKLIGALSDKLYDRSFDLADLKDLNFKEIRPWIRPFEIVVKQSGLAKEDILRGTAILVDRYAVIPVTPDNKSILEAWDSAKHAGRIIFDSVTFGNNDAPRAYEEAAFMGFGGQNSQKRVAVFLRFNNTKFPIPNGLPFVMGASKNLGTGDALYALGITDMSSMFPDISSGDNTLLRPNSHPSSFVGRRPNSPDFYFQGSIFSDDIGAPIFALLDGNLELVGIVTGNVREPKAEIFNTALGIETVLEEIKKIVCSDPSIDCATVTRGLSGQEPQTFSLSGAAADRSIILTILKEEKLDDSSLSAELLRPNLDKLGLNVKKIIVLFFNEEGALLQTPSGPFAEGEAIILSNEYILTTSALLPNVINAVAQGVSGGVIGPDLSDLTSDTFPIGKKKIRFRFAILYAPLPLYEIMERLTYIPLISNVFVKKNDSTFLEDQTERQKFLEKFKDLATRYSHPELIEDLEENSGNPAVFRQILMDPSHQQFLDDILKFYLSEMEIPEVVLISRQNWYAFLRRPLPPFGYYQSSFPQVSYEIGDKQLIQPNRSIYIPQVQSVFNPYPALLSIISEGTIISSPDNSGSFLVNGMVFQNSVGAPIFKIKDGKAVFLGMVKNATIFPEFETEGSAIPLQLILEKIKQKTGLDPLGVEPSSVLPPP